VGLEEDGEPTAGAVYDPTARELFLAGPDHPTTGNGERVAVRTGRTLREAALATYLRADKAADRATTLERLVDNSGVVRAGGAGTLELAWVAAGRVDAWAQPNVSEWDWVPGAALVRHAGGTIAVLDGEPAWHLAGSRELVAALAELVPRR
jgi:fructose-1,6-bisphosphatase/inositol monophosphatase family enzyme